MNLDVLRTILMGGQPMANQAVPLQGGAGTAGMMPGASPALSGGLPDFARIVAAAKPQAPVPTGAPMDIRPPNPGETAPQGLMAGLRSMFGGGEGGDLRTLLGDIAAGTAGVDPTSAPISALAQGFAGAMGQGPAREEAARKRQIEDEDRQLKLEDRAFDRRMRQAAAARSEASGARAARTAELSELKTLTEIMRGIRGGDLSTSEKLQIERLVRDHATSLEEQALPPEEIMAQTEAFRDDLMTRITGTGELAPDPAEVAGAPDATMAGFNFSGDGSSQDKPMQFPDDETQAQAAFQKLPSGAWFVNPADGRVLQKQ